MQKFVLALAVLSLSFSTAAIAQQQERTRVVARLKKEMTGNVDHGIALQQRAPHRSLSKVLIQLYLTFQHAAGQMAVAS